MCNSPEQQDQSSARLHNESGQLAIAGATEQQDVMLSEEETRQILTPFAFKIDKTLFGIALAAPWRRGLALLIDLLFIAILSGAPGELLALVVAITFFRIGSKKRAQQLGKKRGLGRATLRVIGAFIVFVVLLENLPKMFDEAAQVQQSISGQANEEKEDDEGEVSSQGSANENKLAIGLVKGAALLAIPQSDCTDTVCWQALLTEFVRVGAEHQSDIGKVKMMVTQMVEQLADNSKINPEQRQQLNDHFSEERLSTIIAARDDIEPTTDKMAEDLNSLLTNLPANENAVNNIVINSGNSSKSAEHDNSKQDSAVYKGFEWAKGIIKDLGLGFGWAAFYFTVSTAIWAGQTPGKKLLRIRVLQLDGTPLSLWDSFGRYGGYGAGLATGLLGFMQIYWDANRQAIHDKISATIVVADNESLKTQLALKKQK